MMTRIMLAAGLVASLGTATAYAQASQTGPAQTTPQTRMTVQGNSDRSPTLGDPGPRTRRIRPAPVDRPGPTSENGNQPDRSEAGGGAH